MTTTTIDQSTMTDHAALIARAHAAGLETLPSDDGLMLWWPHEDPSKLLPLAWEEVPYWLDEYVGDVPARERIRPAIPQEAERFDAIVSMMDADEARQCVARINAHLNGARAELLRLYEGRGWQALGYTSWRACVTAEFEQSQALLYRELQAAQIEQRISTQVEIGTIPAKQLVPLARLAPAEQAVAWERAVETAPNGKLTASHVAAVVEAIRAPKPVLELAPQPEPEPRLAQVAPVEPKSRTSQEVYEAITAHIDAWLNQRSPLSELVWIACLSPTQRYERNERLADWLFDWAWNASERDRERLVELLSEMERQVLLPPFPVTDRAAFEAEVRDALDIGMLDAYPLISGLLRGVARYAAIKEAS